MATRIVMPRLGDFMTEGTVVRLAKAQGDNVGQGEVIAEIETEKLNYDLEATEGGVFHPVVDEGATVAVDGLIGYLLAEGEAVEEPYLVAIDVDQHQPCANLKAIADIGQVARPRSDLVCQ